MLVSVKRVTGVLRDKALGHRELQSRSGGRQNLAVLHVDDEAWNNQGGRDG